MRVVLVVLIVQSVFTEYKDLEVEINGEHFTFSDLSTSSAVDLVAAEFKRDEYRISGIKFQEGDVVIDIGANVGIFSIYLARRFPFLKIYSFEPVKESYDSFLRNIHKNGVADNVITLVNKAVTKDGRNVTMFMYDRSTACSTMSENPEVWFRGAPQTNIHSSNIQSITLDGIFNEFQIDHCKLLKIDCEGCEYEVLSSTSEDVFKKIEILRGEFHKLVDKGRIGRQSLFIFIAGKIKDVHVSHASGIIKRETFRNRIQKKRRRNGRQNRRNGRW